MIVCVMAPQEDTFLVKEPRMDSIWSSGVLLEGGDIALGAGEVTMNWKPEQSVKKKLPLLFPLRVVHQVVTSN